MLYSHSRLKVLKQLYTTCIQVTLLTLTLQTVNIALKVDSTGKYVIQTTNSLYYGFFGDTIELSKLDFMGSFTSSNLLTIKGREVVMTSFFDSDGKVEQSDTVVDLLAVEQFARENSKLEKILGGKR